MTSTEIWTVVVGMITNVSCAILGCYLLLRRMSLLGDAISHGVLPGIAFGFFLSGQITGPAIVVGAMLFGVLTAYLTETVRRYGKVSEDASLGVVYTSLFALGVVLIARIATKTHLDVECVLMGEILLVVLHKTSVLGVNVPEALPTLVFVLLLTIGFVLLFWKELKIVSFDPCLATAMGINAALMHYLLMGMVAAVTVTSFEIVGSILVIAMLIVPAATAHLLTDRLPRMMCIAALVGIVSAVVGYAATHWINSSFAGMMAVVAGLQFTLAVFLAPRHGLLSRGIRNARLGLRIAREDVLSVLYKAEEASRRGDRSVAALSRDEIAQVATGLRGRLAVAMLRHKQLIQEPADRRVELTGAGRARALEVVRAHRLWESFLVENLSLPPDHLHEPAHAMEHFIGPGLQAELESQVERADVDPHGRAIPPAKQDDD